MRRREALAAAAGLGLAAPLVPAAAQPGGRVFKLGWLRPNAAGPGEFQSLGIPAALKRLGWVEGQNLTIERRWAGAGVATLPHLARELVQLHCDALLTVGQTATRAARDATGSTPIVLFGNFDPLRAGLVDSLARPGGNITGVVIAPDGTLAGKKVELLKEAVPEAARVALLSAEDPAMQGQIAEARRAAETVGQTLSVVTVRGGDYAGAFRAITANRAQALYVGSHTTFMTDRKLIIELALRHQLPTMWEWAEQVRDGGLMSYGTSLAGLYERVAGYLDRIFKGGRISDMPVERPTTFQLVINQRTARAIGLSLPQTLLLRADEVIE